MSHLGHAASHQAEPEGNGDSGLGAPVAQSRTKMWWWVVELLYVIFRRVTVWRGGTVGTGYGAAHNTRRVAVHISTYFTVHQDFSLSRCCSCVTNGKVEKTNG